MRQELGSVGLEGSKDSAEVPRCPNPSSLRAQRVCPHLAGTRHHAGVCERTEASSYDRSGAGGAGDPSPAHTPAREQQPAGTWPKLRLRSPGCGAQ